MSESHSSGVLQGERTSSPTKVSFWRLAGESPADATGTLDQLEKRPVEKRQRVEFVRTVPEQGKQPLENLVAGHCLTEGEFNLPDEGVSILNSRIREMEGQLASSLTGIGPSTFSQKIANRNDSNAVLNDAGKLGSKRGGTRKSTRKTDERWDEMFQQLVEYKEINGDCLVPARYAANPKLAKWVETARYEYTKLKKTAASQGGATCDNSKRPTNTRLTEERLSRLESIGFQWKVKNKMRRFSEKQWDQMLERLKAYKKTHGHCLVPRRYSLDPKLGSWVHSQRKGSLNPKKKVDWNQFRDNVESFRLLEDRRRRLDAIGFAWSCRPEPCNESPQDEENQDVDRWDNMFSQLQAYKERYGNCSVPKRFSENPKLATWVDNQRVKMKKMKNKLAEEGIIYDENRVDDESQTSTTEAAVGRLVQERIRRLNSIGFAWSLRDDWQKSYEALKIFKLRNGHCNVPARYPENKKLAFFVTFQRRQYRVLQDHSDPETRPNFYLTPERIDLLNEIGFSWTVRSRSSLTESWKERLEDLKVYKATKGDCLVPARYPPNPGLGHWVVTQRNQYKRHLESTKDPCFRNQQSIMSRERIRALDSIGFQWSIRTGNESKCRDKDESVSKV